MKYWYGLLGLVGVTAILGIGVLVITSSLQSSVTPSTVNVTLPKVKSMNAIVSTNAAATPTTTLTFVGDVMLDRYVRTTIEKNSPVWPFEKIRNELIGQLVIGNLEGPITANPSVATNTNLVFTFDPNHVPGLTAAGFTHFSLANNHTLNFGQVGLDQTRSELAANTLQHFGDPKNRTGYSATATAQGRKIVLLGYHGLVGGRETVLAEIQQARTDNAFVIVMPHWGNEYQVKASAKQISDAHALIDAGADLIIGAHPHVIQPIEVYKDKMIFYSLGNFLFDQYFSPATQRGLMVRVTLDDEVVSATLIPVTIVAGQIQLPSATERDAILDTMATDSTVPNELRQSIKSGRVTLPLLP